ncbi:hypothetical protein B9Z19DRAFT_231012 [Tuber borchii]|uniref:Uncharacterized protein n=1 Tax=Tuber borchii TaxID=42251 RepID=A0A2T6ZMG8_TUBBO|nr:hypothetical protein B9Z19DRAFT_231012 [Tuber borchii]
MVFSASISGVLIALLIIMQTLTAVLALPTATTTTSTITTTTTTTTSASPQLEARQTLDSNQDNNNNDHSNDTEIVPPNNATTSKREFAIRAMLPQFNKRDNSENQEHGSNGMSPGEVLAIVIAALTLLVSMIPLFRCPRLQCWISSTISPFVQSKWHHGGRC